MKPVTVAWRCCGLMLGLALVGPAVVAQEAAGPGRLVIAGGGVSDHYHEINGAQLVAHRLGGKPIGVIAAAADNPSPFEVNRFNSRFGAGSAIYLDITATNGGANDPAIVELIRNCGGIFFPGGDQVLITRALLNSNGTPTPAMNAIRELHASGAPIGGTSAGAAIMSDPMISGGNSADALRLGPGPSSAPSSQRGVTYRRGLGFHPGVLYDQHFLERGRFGRLLSALARGQVETDLGIGIAEDTAIVVDHAAGTGHVVGASGAVVIDVSTVELGTNGELFGARVHYLDRGDTFHYATRTITPASGKILRTPSLSPAPIALPAWGSGNIFTLISRLVDTQNTSIAVAIDPVFDVVFSKLPETTAWRQASEPAGTRPTWTVANLEVSVVRRVLNPYREVLQDWQFDDPAGTQLSATVNSARPGIAWSGDYVDVATTGSGALRIQRVGTNNNRRFDVEPPEDADELVYAVRIARWRFGNAGAAGEPVVRFHLMNGLAAAQPGDITAGFTLAHVAGQGVTLEANATGTAAPGGQSSAPALLFPSVLDEPLTIAARYHRRQHFYEVHYQRGDGPWVNFFRGHTSGVRDGLSARMATAGDFKGSGQDFIELDRVMVARELRPAARGIDGTQAVRTETVEIAYEVDAIYDGPWQSALFFSPDGGETWTRATQIEGDVAAVPTGGENRVRWDAGSDLPADFVGEVLLQVEVAREVDEGEVLARESLAGRTVFVDVRRFPDAPHFHGFGGSELHDVALVAGDRLRLSFFGLPPYRYAIEGSNDLQSWTPLSVQLPDGPASEIEPTVPAVVNDIEVPFPQSTFFRLVQRR